MVSPADVSPSPLTAPPPRDGAAPRTATLGADRFEVYLGRISGVFGLLYVLQTAHAFAVDLPSTPGPLGVASASLVVASVVCGLGASVHPPRARSFLYGAIALFAAAAVVWLLAIRQPIPATPYPYFLAAAVAPLAYLAVVCRRIVICFGAGLAFSAYLGVALIIAGGQGPAAALVDALFVAAMSIGLPLLVTAVRRGVRRADTAQATALAGYARTRSEDATEAERRRTDALLHDAVLTTYLSAAAADTPEQHQLVTRMAANARRVLAHLNSAAERGPAVSFDQAYAAMRAQLEPFLPAFAVRADTADVVLPSDVADAVLQSMLHAMENSVQHARAEGRELQMSPLGPDGIRITVQDDGVGFDASPAALATTPMRWTVMDRMQRVDGRADIRSAPGQGCSVVLSWGSIVMSGVAPLPDLPAVVTA